MNLADFADLSIEANATDVADEYDSPWKDILMNAFPEFMAFYFAEASEQIDWSKGHEFKNTELRQVVRDAKLGKRFADVLVEVTLLNGQQRWVYIHIEIQGERDQQFAQRMFTYNYRLYDRYACPVASMAVLADDNQDWKPSSYGFDVLGCQHTLSFPVAKLLDFADRVDALEQDNNPFALVTAAHLRTKQTRQDTYARYQAKRILVRLLYRQGWDRQRVLDLFAVLDWMMRLPDGLEQKLWQEIEDIEGEQNMRYVTSVERLAIQRGMAEGMQQGIQQGMQQGIGIGTQQGALQGKASVLEVLLTRRFGPLDKETQNRLKNATGEQLDLWIVQILDAPTLQAVFSDH